MFRYLSLTTLTDSTFVVFLVSWIISREVGLLFVLHTIYSHAPKHMINKWSPAENHYWCTTTRWIFMAALGSLFLMATTWFYSAVVVAIRVVRGLGAEDVRSDEEDENDDDEEGESDRSALSADSASDKTQLEGRLKVEKKVLDAMPDVHAHVHQLDIASGSELKKRR